MDLDALILLVFLLLKKVLSASSYCHFTATKQFRSQCHILLVLMEGALNGAIKGTFKGKFERHSSLINLRGESAAHEAQDVFGSGAGAVGCPTRGQGPAPHAKISLI